MKESSPHVVIADVTLCDVPPKVLCRFVRSSDCPPYTCLIGVAAGLTDGQGQALLQEGFDGYLSKPFEIRSLVRLIEQTTSASAERTGA